LKPTLTLKKAEGKDNQSTNFDIGNSFCLKSHRASFKDVPVSDGSNGWINQSNIKIETEDFTSS
jgi:hypothetical protein